jgi:CSLREA domain-containing protein
MTPQREKRNSPVPHCTLTVRLAIAVALALGLAACGSGGGGPAGATYLVNTSNDVDDGACNGSHCSLREAINAANAHPGSDTITFNIAGGGVQTISPTSALPEITDAVVIDGTTQPGYSGSPTIELNGTNTPDGANGLTIKVAGCTVRGLVINRFHGSSGGPSAPGYWHGAGIALVEEGNDIVEGNYLGTNVNGTGARPNERGVMVWSSGNTIGGTTAASRNVISGNVTQGIEIEGEDNLVEGNYVGTDATGTVALGNGAQGVFLLESRTNTIGGTAAGAGNVISGNVSDGVYIHFGCTNWVRGNRIGTDATGAAALPNGRHGVMVWDAYVGGCGEGMGNVIGGTAAGARNVISGNTRCGVVLEVDADQSIVQGNLIGPDASGLMALPGQRTGIFVHSAHNVIGGTSAGARNVISGNQVGVFIAGGDQLGNELTGNYIGTDVTGMAALGNTYDGVELYETGGNSLGANVVGAANVISGNGHDGLWIMDSSQNSVLGNYIGTNAGGTQALGNAGNGVVVAGEENIIGNGGPNGGNLISGNAGNGVIILPGYTVPATGNQVAGNMIGTDVTGLEGLGNAEHGVLVQANANFIGGPALGRNTISGNGGDGVRIEGAIGNRVQSNYIGTDVSGTAALGNAGNGVTVGYFDSPFGAGPGEASWISGNGPRGSLHTANLISAPHLPGSFGGGVAGAVLLSTGDHDLGYGGGGSNNIVGGSGAGEGNVISGNLGSGVALGSPLGGTVNMVQGNHIGTDVTGSLPLGNGQHGVWVLGVGNVVGGSSVAARNWISANGLYGVYIQGEATVVQSNYIGMDVTGLNPLPNEYGVYLESGASQNLIGGEGAGNSIAFNTAAGVAVLTEDGTGNLISSNAIWANGGLGIAEGAETVIPNDPGDYDTGANNLQNFPNLVSAVVSSDGTTFTGTLNSTLGTVFTLEFFTNNECDPSGFGEGRRLVHTISVTTNVNGLAMFTVNFPNIFFHLDQYVTATATDPANNTSGFSNCIPVTEGITPMIATLPPTGVFLPAAVSTDHFYYRGSGCGTHEVRIEVQVADPGAVASVGLFYRLRNQEGEGTTEWNDGAPMTPLGGGVYALTLVSEGIPNFTAFDEAWLQYQFVALDAAGAIVGRSDVFSDVQLSVCHR